MHRCFRANGNGHAVEKAGSLQFAESSPSLRGSSLSLSDLTMEAFLLLFLVRSSRWPLETRVSFPRARSHFISSAILLRLFLLSLSLLTLSFRFFSSVLGSSQAGSFESYNSERASFRSRSGETVSSRGYEMIVQRSLSRRRGDGERLGGLLMEVRGVSAERIETFGRGGATYAQGL